MCSRLFFEPIPSLQELEARAAEQDLCAVEALTAPARRAEALAWRTIVRRELGEQVSIAYDEWGAPVVEGAACHIGVSHSGERVAVIVGEGPCAVDIERCDRNFDRVVSRYLSDEELALSSYENYKAVAWCTKECLYKYYRRKGLDFLRDIRIVEVAIEQGRISGTILGGEKMDMKVEFKDGYVVVTLD